MEFKTLLYQKEGSVLRLTLNRPDVYNAIDDTLSYELQDALKAAEKDSEVRVIIFTGTGKAFCSGQDLKAISGIEKRSFIDSINKRYNPIIRAMRTIPKPIICRLNGVAAGAGCSLALACDFIVASESAVLVEAFINIGLVLDSGSSFFLPRMVGSTRAFEIATMAPKISGQQAFDWGIANRVTSPENLDTVTDEIAAYYAAAPTKAIGLMKKMLNRSTSNDMENVLEYEAYCQEIAGNSEDNKEGVRAFIEKRKPDFKGK